jgi:hypothetical protein
MKNGSRKIERLAASLLIVLSLFASSIAACCCAHHEEKTRSETASCHSPTLETKAENHHTADSVETKSESKSDKELFAEINVLCECFGDVAPQVFVKNENVKIEKQSVTNAAAVKLPEAAFAASLVAFESIFTPPFYLSDSFYNYSPGRAPPRL